MGEMRCPRGRSDRGAALLMVLMMVSVMSVTVMTMADALLLSVRRTANVAAVERATWYALGAEELAGSLIARSLADDPGLTRLSTQEARSGAVFPIPGGLITAVLRDGSNCFNLNSVVRGGGLSHTASEEGMASYTTFLRALGVPGGEASRLTAALVDWIDQDTSTRNGGAEDVDYSLRDPSHRSGAALLADVSELRAIVGYEANLYQLLRTLTCARPTVTPSPLNVNSMGAEDEIFLHAALDGLVSLEQARKVIADRPPGGYNDAAQVLEHPVIKAVRLTPRMEQQIAVTSSVFDVTITVVQDEAYVALRSTLQVSPDGRVNVMYRRFGDVQ